MSLLPGPDGASNGRIGQDAAQLVEELDLIELVEVLNLRTLVHTQELHEIDATVNVDVTTLGIVPDGVKREVVSLAGRIFDRWNQELHQLFCGEEAAEDRTDLLAAVGIGPGTAAAFLAIKLVAIGLSGPLAAVIGALVYKYVLEPAADELCSYWASHLGLPDS